VSEPRDRIARFDREMTERLSTRTESCRFGTAFYHEGFPRRWDSNFVWVEGSLEGVGAEELADDADDVLGRAGLAHRQLYVAELERARRLTAGFEALGYEIDRDVTMVHTREPDRWTDARAEEIDLATAKRFYATANREMEDGVYAADAEMLADFHGVIAERVDTRFFGATLDGEVVAACELYLIGRTAQVEDVFTLTEHRGHGLGRVVVLAAVRAAREAGADLVHLYADDEDWPKQMYAKLGFDEVDRSMSFLKVPPAQRA
jgi:GNAT superfamily N-acetyltransferase